jgi:hypothetical protein
MSHRQKQRHIVTNLQVTKRILHFFLTPRGLQKIFGKTEYLTLDPGAGTVTETGQIKAANKFKYLGSILQATGAATLEIEKRISEGRRVIGMLNSVLWSKTILHKTKKLMYQALV